MSQDAQAEIDAMLDFRGEEVEIDRTTANSTPSVAQSNPSEKTIPYQIESPTADVLTGLRLELDRTNQAMGLMQHNNQVQFDMILDYLKRIQNPAAPEPTDPAEFSVGEGRLRKSWSSAGSCTISKAPDDNVAHCSKTVPSKKVRLTIDPASLAAADVSKASLVAAATSKASLVAAKDPKASLVAATHGSDEEVSDFDDEDTLILDAASPSTTLDRGPDLLPGLARKADERWQKFYNYKQEDFTIPGNLHKIKAPGLNQEIWDHLPRPSRKSDKGFLRQQQMLQAVAISTAKNAELFLKELRTDRENVTLKSALSTSLDSISMLGSISFSLGKTRRYRLKNVLNDKINHICDIRYDADDVQGRTSDWLFGDDLNETIARGEKNRKLKASISIPGKEYSFPYQPRSSNFQPSHSGFRRARYSSRPPRSGRSRYQRRGR